jgi:C4-dicarboxylate-specific signal transduction histidine kinase
MPEPSLPPEWLARANRLAMVAAVLSTTVHEVNNALQIISGSAEMLGPGIPGDVLARRAETIGGQARRASALLAELSAFARDDPPDPDRADLGHIGQRALAMRQYTHARLNIQSGFERSGGRFEVASRPRAIMQIVLNLLVNAERALAGRRDGRIVVGVATGRDRVELTVDDNGPGLRSDAAARPFAPRFDAAASGLGIGLSVSRWLADREGGALDLADSRLGGCAITLSLRPAP